MSNGYAASVANNNFGPLSLENSFNNKAAGNNLLNQKGTAASYAVMASDQ